MAPYCSDRICASLQVLGIIFAVFVVLWTPFFVLNVLSVACMECVNNISPPFLAAIGSFFWQ